MLYRTCRAPVHSITQPRQGTGDWVLPATAHNSAHVLRSTPVSRTEADRTPGCMLLSPCLRGYDDCYDCDDCCDDYDYYDYYYYYYYYFYYYYFYYYYYYSCY